MKYIDRAIEKYFNEVKMIIRRAFSVIDEKTDEELEDEGYNLVDGRISPESFDRDELYYILPRILERILDDSLYGLDQKFSDMLFTYFRGSSEAYGISSDDMDKFKNASTMNDMIKLNDCGYDIDKLYNIKKLLDFNSFNSDQAYAIYRWLDVVKLIPEFGADIEEIDLCASIWKKYYLCKLSNI